MTLGCKVNQYETELVRQSLATAGYRDAAATSRPICAWSTPAPSRPKGTRRAGRSFANWHAAIPARRIVVMGCYATRAPRKSPRCPASWR